MRRRALVLTLLSFAGWLAIGAGSAHANRFGSPWQARVTVDQTLVYAQPDLGWPPR